MPDSSQKNDWLHHRQDEVDAAYLYEQLATLDQNPRQRKIFEKLAGVENRHAEMWDKILTEHGIALPPREPSLKARLQAWAAKRFGPGFLLSMMLREEGAEVKAYLKLHSDSEEGTAKTAALRLAQESAQHASTLQDLAGTEGEPWHQAESGDLLRNIVYGFNDGLTANFGLVAGVVGGGANHYLVLLSGLAGTVADALSMGSSGYLAAVSQREVYEHEIEMERQEILLMPEVEQEELALIYQAKGIEETRARGLAAEVMKNPRNALDEKIREELNIGELNTTPVKDGVITGVATAVGALIPVAPFLILDARLAIWVSFAISMLAHFGVGAARSLFTGRGIIRSGMDMFVVGFGVAAVSYFFGDVLVRWFSGGAG